MIPSNQLDRIETMLRVIIEDIYEGDVRDQLDGSITIFDPKGNVIRTSRSDEIRKVD